MTTSIVAAPAAACQTCHGFRVVPDPEQRGVMMGCPACDGGPDDEPGAGALPAGPVGRLDVWAVAGEDGSELQALPVNPSRPLVRVEEATDVADGAARILRGHPHFAGGEVRVCDAAGHVWHRQPIRAAA